ncbi:MULTISPECIES: hypothetical protein [unclassified Pseudomonas]|uniref:hypothetical protein n=1 Tax=unclassified Pseudomonas TaxID=196821 RepID=UPI000BC91492|nr:MULTISPECIES: hypothetical protein [unclassified Pseudomonas]PVZ19861.1 hypothetical protein F474_00451 [Pseudomonas sp. URIL14HWK12:I12]PVZ26927.1 hypothetical protein F470_00106 [Pseudomonas sp. URIL14HWK12:I10]PVZ37816.1 hypothetical protein F472_00451 [Pseudomonas sp. URIL14HWK12:I11]SNZ05553.1 hypothetical protein SAMN05660463_00953 [Pseudomonas sp. URIL14HWK12:I9]
MKRRVMGLIVAGLLAGCSSQQQDDNAPTWSGTSSKAPEQYGQCLLPKWQTWRPQARQDVTDSGVRLVASAGFTQALISASIDRDGSGSKVQLFVPQQWRESRAWVDMAKACQ